MTRRTPEQVDADHAHHVGSGPHDGPRCRCQHDGQRWLVMCDAALAHWIARHERAMLEHSGVAPAREAVLDPLLE